MNQTMNQTTTTIKRDGTVYVLVLMISMLVTVIGLSALSVVRVQLKTSMLSSDVDDARLYAQSAVELAKQWIYADPNWRTTRSAGAWATGVAIGSGTFSVSIADPVDGNIANSPMDPLVITATGYKGRARQQIQCTLAPAPVAYSCLQSAVISNGALNITGGRLTASGLVSSNGNMTTSGGGLVDANAEAGGTITGSGYVGTKTAGVALKTMPNSTTVFDYYIANGTAISYASLPGGDMSGVVLTPTYNPFGATSANGIYVIDCGGAKIKTRYCRIVGTLVLLNPKSGSDIGKVNITPAVPGYPALLVKGTLTVSFDATTALNESNGNLNPPGAPYLGVSNSTTADTYPAAINGLVYISGSSYIYDNTQINGALVVGGTLGSDQTPTVTWTTSSLTNPPPGFFDPPPLKVVATTWAQSVN